MPSVKPTSGKFGSFSSIDAMYNPYIVHRLSPYNVDVVAAMGDSVTVSIHDHKLTKGGGALW